MSLAKNSKDIVEIKQDLTRLRPVRMPGILTNDTTQGVGRRPLSTATQTTQTTKASVPRWG